MEGTKMGENELGIYYVNRIKNVEPRGNWNSTILSFDLENKTYKRFHSSINLEDKKGFLEVVKRDDIEEFEEELINRGFKQVMYGENYEMVEKFN